MRKKRTGNRETLNEIMSRQVIRRQSGQNGTPPAKLVHPGYREPSKQVQPARDEQRIQELRTMPYRDYLQTPEWKAKQQQILKRDEYKCRVCNSAERLNVHHRTYERRGDEDLNDLTTLCQPCHEYFHNRDKQEPQKQKEQIQDLVSKLPPRSPRFGSHTFKTFNPRVPGVQEAYEECVAYARNPDGWLLLVGPCGCGKTHLATSIANQCAEKREVSVYSVPDLLDYLRSSSEQYQVLCQLKEVELLVLDDLGVQQSSPWVSEKLFQIVDYRYKMRAFTIICADPKGLQNIDERLLSRLSDNNLVTPIVFNHAQDYRPNHPIRD